MFNLIPYQGLQLKIHTPFMQDPIKASISSSKA
jgi:hypothetical protein